jgi:hypothetical protein
MAFTDAWRLLIDADTRGDVTTPDRAIGATAASG